MMGFELNKASAFLGFFTLSQSVLLAIFTQVWPSVFAAWALLLVTFFSHVLFLISRLFKGSDSAFPYLMLYGLIYILFLNAQLLSFVSDGYPYLIYGFESVSDEAIVSTCSLFCMFIGVLILFYKDESRSKDFKVKVGDQTVSARAYQKILLLVVISILPYLVGGFGGLVDLILKSRAAGGGNSVISHAGSSSLMVLFSSMFPLSVVVLVSVLYLGRLSLYRRVILMCCLVVLVVIAFASGTRTLLAFLFIPIVLMGYMLSRNTFNYLIKLIFLLGIILVLFNGIMKYRQGGFESFSQETNYNAFSGTELLSEVYIIQAYYAKPLSCDNTFSCILKPPVVTAYQILTHVLPRSYFTWKYSDVSFEEYNFFRVGVSGLLYGVDTNITPTIIGRYLLLYGVPGVMWLSLLYSVFFRYFCFIYVNKNSLVELIISLYGVTLFAVMLRDLNMHLTLSLLLLLGYRVFNKKLITARKQ